LLELDWPDLAAPAEVTSPASALPDPESAPPLLEPAAAEAMEDVQNKEQPAPESQGLEVEMATDFGMSLADFGFDDPEAPAMADSASPADTEPEGGVDTVPLAPAGEVAEPAWPEDLDLDLDFGPMSGLPEQPSAPAELAPVVEPQTQAVSETQAEPAFDAEVGYEEAWTAPAQPAVSEDLPEDAQAEDPVKIIGGLRLNIPLYNVYLNEADEWSRRLATELNEWALQPLAVSLDTASALAHSLAGSSATVGFMGLSELARALEHALDHVQLGAHLDAAQVQLLLDVCDDIRRLLHQFAAGFLKQPDPRHIPALHALLALPVSDTGLGGLDDADAANTSALRERPETPPELEQEPEPFTVADLAPLEPAPAAPVPLWQDDDIEVKDAPDVDLFPIFEEEALELLPQLSAAMRQWAARPGQASARGEILRVLHTLKGSARLAGAMRLGEMTHRLESAVEQVLPESATPVQIEPLLARLDAIGADFDQLRASGQDLLRLPEALPVPAAPPAPATAEPLTLQNKELPSPVLQGLEAELSAQASAPAATHPVAAPAPLVAMPPRKAAGQTIRVRAQLLDRMVNQAGEVMTSRTRLESRLGQMQAALGELTGNLDRLRGQLREMELQSESQLQSRLAQSKDTAQAFDPLEFDRFTRVQELTRMMAESVHDVATLQRTLQQTAAGVEDDLILQARQTRELQRDLLRARMVEFESIAERLYGVVRQAAKDAGKQVTLDIEGGAIEMDRGVLERMATAFEHLLRNAVGHGIEAPEQRLAAGKPAAGVIRIHLQQLANDVVVTFADDGGGLDLPRIRAKALALGLVQPEQTLGDDDVAQLIFSAGLSTATEVSGLAGRGIGMDVVRSEVHALGGRIEVASKAGQGTEFRLLLPLTTAVSQVVLLRLGDATVGVPANLVELVRRVPAATLGQAYAQGVFDYNGQPLPFFWAGALLQLSAHSSEPPGKTVSVAVFRSAGRLVALHVDEVLGNQEVVVKNLGPQLARLPGLAGMSLLASGAVVLIYNPVALVATYGEQARAAQHAAVTAPDVGEAPPTAANSPAPAPQVPLVLVVDDSITVRRVTQRLLKREGFRVALANDGLHALEVLQQEKPAVVLTDIEMPRMDGFDLVRNIRADAQLAGLPIIMITSRIAEKHREYARELKVDHYLGKPYPEDVLIELVRGYCQAAAPLTTA
jgi:chemosensory pili system protein ChpA (sensor histidine kinase/response regulator)